MGNDDELVGRVLGRRQATVLTLALRVLQVAQGRCTPLKDAVVDIWHCDAAGLTTVLPGWYRGRTGHDQRAGRHLQRRWCR